jgi:hypothetical protein
VEDKSINKTIILLIALNIIIISGIIYYKFFRKNNSNNSDANLGDSGNSGDDIHLDSPKVLNLSEMERGFSPNFHFFV